MMFVLSSLFILTLTSSISASWTLNDLYKQFIDNAKPEKQQKAPLKKSGNDRRDTIHASIPLHSENDKYEVKTFDVDATKSDKKSNFHQVQKHSNIFIARPTFGISNFVHENRYFVKKPQVTAWSGWDLKPFVSSSKINDITKKTDTGRPKDAHKPVVTSTTDNQVNKESKFDLMLPKHVQVRGHAPTPGIIATKFKPEFHSTYHAAELAFPCHESSPSVLCPTATTLVSKSKLEEKSKHSDSSKTQEKETQSLSPIDALILNQESKVKEDERVNKNTVTQDIKANENHAILLNKNAKTFINDSDVSSLHKTGNENATVLLTHSNNIENVSSSIDKPTVAEVKKDPGENKITSNQPLDPNQAWIKLPHTNLDLQSTEDTSKLPVNLDLPSKEDSSKLTHTNFDIESKGDSSKLTPNVDLASKVDSLKTSSLKFPVDAIDLPDLRGILSINFDKKVFKYMDCVLVANSSVCGVSVKFKEVDSVNGEFNGKISFTALMNRLLPNFNLAAPSNDLIVHGKFDATGFEIDRCLGRISFHLQCRELLDIIPNKLRVSKVNMFLNFSFEQQPKDISNFNIMIKGSLNLDFRSRMLFVSVDKPLASTLFKIEMTAMDLEIPEFTKLFTDIEIPQDNLPPDLATLVTSSLRNPRITGLYDSRGAFEFIASARSPASIFPSQPWVYVIIQKPRLDNVVSGLIASFENAQYRSFLSSILNQDLSNMPLFSDVNTDMAIGVSPDSLYVVRDEGFNKEVGSLFNAGKTIKKGLTVKAKLPIRKMLAELDNSNNTQSFPETVLINIEVTENRMHIEFPEELRIGLSGVPELFAQHGQDMNFPKETFSVEDTELKIIKYEIVDVDKKIILVEFSAPSAMRIGSLMTIDNVKATLKRDALSKWSFVANGEYMLEKTSVSISLTSQTNGFIVTSKPSSIRSGLLVNLLDKEKKLLTPELQRYHMQDFVIEDFKVAGSLTDKNIIRFSGKPAVFGVEDGRIEVIATENNFKEYELAMGVLFKNVDLDVVFGRMLDRKMVRRSWASGVNIGLIISPTNSPLEFQFESEGLSRTKIQPGVHLRVLLVRPEYNVCKGDSLCRVLSAEMPHGSAFHLSGGMENGVLLLSASIKEPLVLSRSLQLTSVTLQVHVRDSVKIFVLASLALRGVGITFSGDMQVDNTGQLQLNMKSESTWDEPFGLKNVRFYNCSLNAVFEPGVPLPIFDMKTRMVFGPIGQDPSKIIQANALVKISSQDPSKNSFSANIKGLTFERLTSACATKKPLLRFQQESVFIDDALLTYEQSNKEEIANEPELMNATDFNYRGDFKTKGRISILGQNADYTIKFLQQNSQILTEIWLPDIGVNQGLLTIRAGLKQQKVIPDSQISNGPTLLIRIDALTNSAVIVGKISTLGFSRISAIKIEDSGFSATIFASLPGNVNTNVSLHSPYKENIQTADFTASACLPIQDEAKTTLFKILRETATQTKKTLIAAEERVTSTEKIYETTKTMIDKYKKKLNGYTVDIRERAETMTKLRKGIKRHCVRDCGDSCMGLPSWKRSGILLAGRNAIGAPSWDPCRKKIPDLNCITRCLGRKVIENVKANNKQTELQTQMNLLTDTKRSLQDAKSLVDRARVLVDATLDGLEKVNKEIKVGIDISKFLNDGKAEQKIDILKACFQDTLDNAERSLVNFIIGTVDHGEEKNLAISAALDGNLVENIDEGIANKLYNGFFEFSKKLEQVKVLLSNLDGEKSEITKQIEKTSDESINKSDQKSQIIWSTEEDEFRRLAYGELPRFTLSDDETIHAFEEKSLWRVAPSNNPLYDKAPGDNQIIRKGGSSTTEATFMQDIDKQTSCTQIRSSVNKYSDIINPLSEFTENFLQEKIMFYRQKNRRLADLRMIDDQIKSDCFLENCTMEDMDNALSYLARARDGTLKWANVIDGQIEHQNKVALGYFSQRTADVISVDKGVTLKQYISKVKEVAQSAIKKSDIGGKVETDEKIQKLAKELHGLLLGVRSSEELSKVAPRIFSMKRQIQSLKRNKIPCSESKLMDKPVSPSSDEQKLRAVVADTPSSSKEETLIIDKTTTTAKPTKGMKPTSKHTSTKHVFTENPVLKNKILHRKDLITETTKKNAVNNLQVKQKDDKKTKIATTSEVIFPEAPLISNNMNNKKELIQTQENLNRLFFDDSASAPSYQKKSSTAKLIANENPYNPFSYWNDYGKWKRSS